MQLMLVLNFSLQSNTKNRISGCQYSKPDELRFGYFDCLEKKIEKKNKK